MVAESPAFLVPTPAMPVAPQIRRILWYDDQMANSDIHDAVTARAGIRLASLIRLDGVHDVVVERT